MRLIEVATSPKSAPRHIPSEASHLVLDALFLTETNFGESCLRDLSGGPILVLFDSPSTARSSWTIPAYGLAHLQTGVLISGQQFYQRDARVALGLADVLKQVSVGVLSSSLFPATAKPSTEPSMPRLAHDDDRRLDATFEALMRHVPEPDDIEAQEQCPTLRYRFPR
jgi:hypothetical protein